MLSYLCRAHVVAILVPSMEFLLPFKNALQASLRTETVFMQRHRRFCLTDAAEACSHLPSGMLKQQAKPVRGEDSSGAESLVLDTVPRFDGLERLIVVAVGLDSARTGGSEGEGGTVPVGDHYESRSQLYRAITRAHFMVAVVNDLQQEGWLK